MDIVAADSAMFPRPSSSSLQMSVKPRSMNFPSSSNNRFGNTPTSKRNQALPSANQTSSSFSAAVSTNASANGSKGLFDRSWQQDQPQRPRSSSLSTSNHSSNTNNLYFTKDRTASENFSDQYTYSGNQRSQGYGGLRGIQSLKAPPSVSTNNNISNNNTQLPSLRSTLDQALGNFRPMSSSDISSRNNCNNTNTNNFAANNNIAANSLPTAASSLTNASSPSDPASLFIHSKPSNASKAQPNNNNFMPVESDVSTVSKSGRNSKSPSPLTIANNQQQQSQLHLQLQQTLDKKKVRFSDPIAHPEPKVKINVETVVQIPGKVAVMSVQGNVREIRPILKGMLFANNNCSNSNNYHSNMPVGIATGALASDNTHYFSSNTKRPHPHHHSTSNNTNSPISSTINTINTMNNTLSNKNIAPVSSLAASMLTNNPTNNNDTNNYTNNSSNNNTLSRNHGTSHLLIPRPATANAAIITISTNTSVSTSNRDASMREMMLMDSPTNANTLAFNARDSLTAQSAHLMRKTMEKLHLSDTNDTNVDNNTVKNNGIVVLTFDDSPRNTTTTNNVNNNNNNNEYSDIDPSAMRISSSNNNSNNTINNTVVSQGGTAVSSALEELRSHHLQPQQQQHLTQSQPSQHFEPLFSDKRRPRTAGPGATPDPQPQQTSQGQQRVLLGKELQQPLLGTVGLLSASLNKHNHSNNSYNNANNHSNNSNINSHNIVLSSASVLFSLPAKAITLGNFSCSAVAPTQFFPQHLVLYFQPAFETARSLTVSYQDMSALTLIGLRFRFKIPAKVVQEANVSSTNSNSNNNNVNNTNSMFVLVEFAPSARVQLVKEKVVPLIAEAQSLQAQAPQQFQLMTSSFNNSNNLNNT